MNKKTEKVLSATLKKNKDNIKLLTTDKEFRVLICKIREDLNIPSIGFDNDEDIRKWSDELTQKSDKILLDKDFREKEIKLKEDNYEQKISYTESKSRVNQLYDQVPIFYLKNRIDFIIDKFNLPLNYEGFLRSYIILNKISNVPGQNFTIGEYPPFVKLREAKFIPVKIFSRLTNDEIESLKEEVTKFSKQLPKYSPLKNIDRDLEIEDWMVNRERFDSVEYKPYIMTTAEIAGELLGSPRKGKMAHDIVKDLKNTRKRRFKSSGKT